MKIITKNQANHLKKPNGPEVWYYLRPEYELHYNEQPAKSSQDWHFHSTISEVVYIVEGSLIAKWLEDDSERSQEVKAGDLVEIGKSVHTFENISDETTKFIVIKSVLSGEDQSDRFKSDKTVVER